MAFSQATIADVTVSRRDADLVVAWASTSPAGTWFQLYVDRSLTWSGTARSAVVPGTAAGVRVRYEVGAVADAEAHTDLSATLPADPSGGRRILLRWQGGTFQGDTSGFHIYTGTTPGGAVDYTAAAGTVMAYSAGIVTDGYGMGGYGQGGYGHAAGSYEWTSDPVSPGTWNAAVVPFDSAGNEGTGATTSAVVAGPPWPPERDADGKRLTYTFNHGTAGGYGTGGYDEGGYGTGEGYGAGGYGQGGYGLGAGEGLSYVTLNWIASRGF